MDISFDDLLELAAPPTLAVDEWLHANILGDRDSTAPMSLREILDLGYYISCNLDEDDREAAFDWCDRARTKALVSVFQGDPEAGLAWASAALRLAWASWKPVLLAASHHDVSSIDEQVRVSTTAASSPDDLARSHEAMMALATRGPPPPYAGHFFGCLSGLVRARVGPVHARASEFAECIAFSVVRPDGSRCTAEIAALRTR